MSLDAWLQRPPRTRVVKLRRSRAHGVVQDCDVYIGRACRLGGWNLPASPWANPFSVEQCGSRAEALRRYRAHLMQRPDLLRQLPTLRGKVLGCWCHPLPCHGDVLAELADATQ